jgi:hypothetical protein
MPIGQAHTVWFPELKHFLKEKWSTALSIPDQFGLVSELNQLLDKIRADYNIKPPMMWCPKCQKRERSRFTPISITSMLYALKRFEVCSEIEFNKLMKEWKLYSKTEGIDIYGKKENDQHEA